MRKLLFLLVLLTIQFQALANNFNRDSLQKILNDTKEYLTDIYKWNKTNEELNHWERNVYVLGIAKKYFKLVGSIYVYDENFLGTSIFNELNQELIEMNNSLSSKGFKQRVYVAYDPDLGQLILEKGFNENILTNQDLDQNAIGKYIQNDYEIKNVVNEFGRLFTVFSNLSGEDEAHIFGIANIKARVSINSFQSYTRLLCTRSCGVYNKGVLNKDKSKQLMDKIPSLPVLSGMSPSEVSVFNALYEGARSIVQFGTANTLIPPDKKKQGYNRSEAFKYKIDKSDFQIGKGLGKKHFEKRSHMPPTDDPNREFHDYTNETTDQEAVKLETEIDKMKEAGELYPEFYLTNDNIPEDVLKQIDQLKGSLPPKKIFFEIHYNPDGSVSISMDYSEAQLTPLQIKCLQKLDEKLPVIVKRLRNSTGENFPELIRMSLELLNWVNSIKGNSIDEMYYNPKAQNYNGKYATIFKGMFQGVVGGIGIDPLNEKLDPHGMSFAFVCGLYNGFVDDIGSAVADLPFMIVLIALDEDFRIEVWNGIRQLSLSKILQIIKEDFDGDAYQNAHMSGKYVFNVASLFFGLGEAKVFTEITNAVRKMKTAFTSLKKMPDNIYRLLKKKTTRLITMGVKVYESGSTLIIYVQNSWKLILKGEEIFYDQLSPAFALASDAVRYPIYRSSDNVKLYMQGADGLKSTSNLRGLDIVDNQDGAAKLVSFVDDASSLLDRAKKLLSDAGRTEMQFDHDISEKVKELLEPTNAQMLQKIGGEEGLLKILKANVGAGCKTCPKQSTLKYLKNMDEYLEDLKYLISNFIDKPGIDKVINAAKSGNLKDIDAVAQQIRVLKENTDNNFVKENILEFDNVIKDLGEIIETSNISEEILEEFKKLGSKCRFDIRLKDGSKSNKRFIEFKSYLEKSIIGDGFPGMGKSKNLQKQLTIYLEEVTSLDDISYFFDWRKLVPDPNVSGAFMHAQIKLPIIKEQFKQMFIEKVDELFKPTYEGGLGLDKMKMLFDINNKSEFLEKIQDINNDVYRFIKVQ